MSEASPSYSVPKPKTPILVALMRLSAHALIGMVLWALLLLVALAGYQATIQDRIVPGVQVADLDIGGMSRDEAAEMLASRYKNVEALEFIFRDGERTWTATAAELGLSFDAADMVERAYAIGHSPDGRRSLREQASAWLQGVNLQPAFSFDEFAALTYVERLADEIAVEPMDAGFQIDGLTVNFIPGVTGRRLDSAAAMTILREAILAREGGQEIPLLIDESPPRQWNLREAAARVQTALSAPLQLIANRANGELLAPWIVTPEQIRAGLSVALRPDAEGMRYHVNVDLSAFTRFLGTLSPNLSTAAVDGRFEFDEGSGQLVVLSPSSAGRRLDVETTIERLEAAVFDPSRRPVLMAFEEIQPRFHNEITAAELGITELVAESTTYYWGSWQNRRSNIAIGAGKLHGVIIAPGEEFSFNYHLGDITPEAGFLDGSVILGGRTVTGIGGGICQVSTTMFRAAFSGGYAITERNSHGYRVGYYEYADAGPGLDAAIWQPEVDLRFQNNTPHHLLIETEFLGAQDALQFRIYSTRYWHTVVESAIIGATVPAPQVAYVESADLALGQIRQIDYSADGADVRVYRNIYDTDGSLVKRDQAYTHYQPWQAVFEVAPGDPRLEIEEDESDGETAAVGSR